MPVGLSMWGQREPEDRTPGQHLHLSARDLSGLLRTPATERPRHQLENRRAKRSARTARICGTDVVVVVDDDDGGGGGGGDGGARLRQAVPLTRNRALTAGGEASRCGPRAGEQRLHKPVSIQRRAASFSFSFVHLPAGRSAVLPSAAG